MPSGQTRAYFRQLSPNLPTPQNLPTLLPNHWREDFSCFAKNKICQLCLPNHWSCSYTGKKKDKTEVAALQSTDNFFTCA
jgi:hypothetical protein